ncbi:hypothetical protein QQS21_002291 [Conoideocrella luteorostrata]|uniref:DUF6590 domain-containing protein n=1 Tax=Conoideocrella luteorostrata TaxID=1105319 RepID=A0AAJ0CVI5_9HYPO|nr:hypothetical protein QQS21_002291 [Conoideocrella luteorostrata]
MNCPTCGHTRQPQPALTKAWWLQRSLFRLAPTRDVSSVQHHVELPEWLKELEVAVKAAWHKRVVRYPLTAVLLLSWKDTDMRFARKEIKRLQSVLEDGYGCEVKEWKIPGRDADLETLDKVRGFLDQYGQSDNLVIVYYAGHGRPGANPGSPPLWYARESSEDGEELDTGAIQQLLTRAREHSPDVLLLHDCCHPLSAHTSNQKESRAVVECIFAGGFESRVPISGPDSFTRALTEELSVAESNGEVISVVELHRRLICRLVNWQPRPLFDENDQLRKDEHGRTILTSESRVTPCHLFLSKRDRTIHLAPKSSARKDKRPVSKRRSAEDMLTNEYWPKALLAIRLVENANNTSNLKSWLLAAPMEVVEFVGIHPSFSSLLLLAVPIPVWDMLPDSDAVSFIGFTTETGPRAKTANHKFPGDDAILHKASYIYQKQDFADDGETHRLLNPANEDQRMVLNILNAIDKVLPISMRLWKKVRNDSTVPAAQWFFDQMRDTITQQPHLYPSISEEGMLHHRDLLFRYLDARELLECDSGLLDISGRLQPLIGPVYNWRDFDQYDVDKASRISSFDDRSVFWSHPSAHSVGESAPSSQGDMTHTKLSKGKSPDSRGARSIKFGRRSEAPLSHHGDDGLRAANLDTRGNQAARSPAPMPSRAEDDLFEPIKSELSSHPPENEGQSSVTIAHNSYGDPELEYWGSTTQPDQNALSVSPGYSKPQYDTNIASRPASPQLPGSYSLECLRSGLGSTGVSHISDQGATDQHNISTPKPYNDRVSHPFDYQLRSGSAREDHFMQYRIEHSSRFQPGEVFKVLWSEPQTSSSGYRESRSSDVEDLTTAVDFNVGFRRLVTIANDQGHATCVPILTYSGSGCLKRGSKPAKHGIAYEAGKKAQLIKGEPKLGFPPVQIKLCVEGESIPKEARINYSKLLTIEHNIKVFFIGNVLAEDWPIVEQAVNDCWYSKVHRRRKYKAV